MNVAGPATAATGSIHRTELPTSPALAGTLTYRRPETGSNTMSMLGVITWRTVAAAAGSWDAADTSKAHAKRFNIGVTSDLRIGGRCAAQLYLAGRPRI